MDGGVILVTGGAVRIGREICLNLAKDGFSVAVHYNSSSNEANSLVEKITSNGGNAQSFSGDLSDVSMVRDLFSEIRDSMGDVTGIVNNASLFSFDDMDSLSKQSWDSHMHVNALVPLLMISELHRNMPSGCVGSVVNILDQKISQPNPDYLLSLIHI